MKQNTHQIALKMDMNDMQVQAVLRNFNSQLVRKLAKELGGDYQAAILEACRFLDEEPSELWVNLDESLQVVIKEQASR